MDIFLAEMLGTAILILLGNGVVANVVLNKTKGQNAGWIVITTGWGFAVAVAVYSVAGISQAHINPAVTISMLATGSLSVDLACWYIGGQMLGAFIGATLVWLHYLPHWSVTEDSDAKLAVFCTAPAIRHTFSNFVGEMIGTMVLVIGVLGISTSLMDTNKDLAAFLIGVLVWSIGLSLGGTTGYAINPARDLAPRLAHALLPIPGKRNSDWQYAWIPVVGPIVGGVAGGWLYHFYLGLKASTG